MAMLNNKMVIYIYILVGGLEHGFYDFPYIGHSNPNWLSYFSEGQVYHQPDI